MISESEALAAQLQGKLQEPRLRWKYAWMKPILGWKVAKSAQNSFPMFRAACLRHCDKAIFKLQGEPIGR